MRNFIFILISAVLTLCACGGSHGPDAGEVAGRTAKIYYDYLIEGKYDAYVDGFYRPDSIPASYRAQLVDNAKMFVAHQQELRGGIAGVSIVRATADTARHVGRAFLMLNYGDSTREEIVVPMVEHKGVWMMR
ncbi:MAG: hypothetical protein ACI3YB_01315 [Prevotella sp.]